MWPNPRKGRPSGGQAATVAGAAAGSVGNPGPSDLWPPRLFLVCFLP